MGKNTFGKTMPRALSQNLKIMGEQIMLARKRLTSPEEIIEEVRAAIKDWRKTTTELQIPIKLLESYSIRWDEL